MIFFANKRKLKSHQKVSLGTHYRNVLWEHWHFSQHAVVETIYTPSIATNKHSAFEFFGDSRISKWPVTNENSEPDEINARISHTI
jgi:hypothetical protein